MAYLENTEEEANIKYGNNRALALEDIDYKTRHPSVKWQSLWILTNTDNVPIQEIEEITNSWYLDIANTEEEYISILSNKEQIKWTWSLLIKWLPNMTCKRIKEVDETSRSWIYEILPDWKTKIEVYCDMIKNGWWWTRYVNIKWNYTITWSKTMLVMRYCKV